MGSEACRCHRWTLHVLTPCVSPLFCCAQARRPEEGYVRLTTDYDALDVANKIGII